MSRQQGVGILGNLSWNGGPQRFGMPVDAGLGSALGLGGATGLSGVNPPRSPPLTPDVLVLLMTDVLVFLQEKDQKYTFPMLVSRPLRLPTLAAAPGQHSQLPALPNPAGQAGRHLPAKPDRAGHRQPGEGDVPDQRGPARDVRGARGFPG